MLFWCTLYALVFADYYFCGTEKLAELEGWWVSQPSNPVFDLATSRTQREYSHRCVTLPGRCNAAVLIVEPATGGCTFQWTLVERNRANPPVDSILSEMSGDSFDGHDVIWKDKNLGKARFFSAKFSRRRRRLSTIPVDCRAAETSYPSTIGCQTPLPDFGTWSERIGLVSQQLPSPTGVAVDSAGNVVISQYSAKLLHTTAPFSLNSTTAVAVFDAPGNLFIDSRDNAYIVLPDRHAVMKRTAGETKWVRVAGSYGVSGEALHELNTPTYVHATPEGDVVIADTGNHRVMHWKPGAEEGIVVAGNGTAGSELHQLSSPAGVAMDHKGDVYVCDEKNNRVMKWVKNATEGTRIGGDKEGAAGDGYEKLNAPLGLALAADIYAADPDTADPNILVVDSKNKRIVMLKSPVIRFFTLVSGPVRGADPLVNPTSLALDHNETNIFLVDSNNNRVVQYNTKRLLNMAASLCTSDLCCRVQCAERHALSDNARFVCNSEGRWQEKSPITCTPLSCSVFPETAIFTTWNNGTLALTMTPGTTLASGEVLIPTCPNNGRASGGYICDRGEIVTPYPWCVAQGLDEVSVTALFVMVHGKTKEEAFINLGSPECEVRYLAYHNEVFSVAIMLPTRFAQTFLHPAFQMEHEMKLRDQVVMVDIDWNFTLPYPRERNKTLIPTPPSILIAPDAISSPGEEHAVWFFFLQLGLVAIGFLMQPLGCSSIQLWRKAPNKVWKLWTICAVLGLVIVGLSFSCAAERSSAITCATSFEDSRIAFESCQRDRLQQFVAQCNTTCSVLPPEKDFCFEPWPDGCKVQDACNTFIDPCGSSTVLMCLVCLALGYFAPVKKCAENAQLKIEPKPFPITLGGCSVAKAGQINRFLQYTVQLPLGVDGGTEVRFALDLPDATKNEDVKLQGQFVVVQAPFYLEKRETFSVLYDRESGEVEVLTRDDIRRDRAAHFGTR